MLKIVNVKLNESETQWINNVLSIFLLCIRHNFTVLLGDQIVFEPCGDSAGTSLVYTNSKEVFEQCTPQSNISTDIIYNHIGEILSMVHVIW